MDLYTYFIVFLVSTIVSYAASVRAQQQAKKAADKAKGVLINRDGTTEQIPVVYGTRRVGGVRVYATSTEGTGNLKNDRLFVVMVLCEGPVESITDIWINGEPLTGSKYATYGNVNITTYLGTDGQTADPDLVALGDGWTSNHTLSGLAYIVFRGEMNKDTENNPWTGGIPEITALVKGKNDIYDPRDMSTGWSDNPALCIRDYMTNVRYGKGLPTTAIDDDLFSDAADLLDVTETLRTAPTGGVVGTIETYVQLGTLDMIRIAGNVVASLQVDGILTNGTAQTRIISAFYDVELNNTFVSGWNITGVFSVSDSVSISASAATGAPFGCNVVIDTSESLFDNLKRLLLGCKGFLPYSNGKYGLVIDALGSSVFTFTTDHIVDGIQVKGADKQSKYNQIIVTYADPALGYQSNQVIFPIEGDATDIALLAEDAGERLSNDVTVDTITSEAAAYNLAKTLLYRSRFNTTVSFRATSEALNLVVGDVIGITYPGFSWSAELFKVEALILNYDGTVQVDAREYNAIPYVFDSLGPRDFTNTATFPSGLIAQPPTSLVLTETTTIANDGTVLPAVLVEWTGALDAFVDSYEVQWKISTDTEYNSMVVSGTQVTLTGVQTGVTYDIRVRSINAYGSRSTWLSGSEAIDGDTTAPSAPTGLGATADYGAIALNWTNPTDADFWQALIYRANTNSVGAAVQIASIAGDGYVDTVGAGVTRYYWVSAIDNTGNESSKTSVASATSLGAGGGNSTYYQTSAPGGASEGDLWFDTDDNDKPYRHNGSSWVAITTVDPSDFNSQNNRNGSSITAPTTATDQTCVDATLSTDKLSADVSFEWSWGGSEGDIDGFYVYVYDRTSSSSYTFGTDPDGEKKFIVPSDVRSLILYNVNSERNYTFGVRAYRKVDPDINSSGEITSSIVLPGHATEKPFLPYDYGTVGGDILTTITLNPTKRTSSVAYGTGAQVTIDRIASDSWLTPQEKLQVLREWNNVTQLYNEIITDAANVGVSYTALTSDYDALGTYLNGGSSWSPGGPTPSWLSTTLTTPTAISGSTFRTNWANFYDEYETLRTSINSVNINPGNPIDSGNIDDVINDFAISNSSTVKASGFTALTTSWVVFAGVTVTRFDSTAGGASGDEFPAVLLWTISTQITSFQNIDVKIEKYASNGTTFIRTLGSHTLAYAQSIYSGQNIDDYDDFGTYGATYVYKLSLKFTSTSGTVSCGVNMSGQAIQK